MPRGDVTKTERLRELLAGGPYDHRTRTKVVRGIIHPAELAALATEVGCSYEYAVHVARGHDLTIEAE